MSDLKNGNYSLRALYVGLIAKDMKAKFGN